MMKGMITGYTVRHPDLGTARLGISEDGGSWYFDLSQKPPTVFHTAKAARDAEAKHLTPHFRKGGILVRVVRKR